VIIPTDADQATLEIGDRTVNLTNLRKVYFARLEITKGALLQYYADVAPALLPHVVDRAMVMKRYPHGIEGKFFYMKRAPVPRPDWVRTCPIEHDSGNIIDFPIVDDVAALLWLVNLGCIDLHPWYARCDAAGQPDYLHFDLDPGTASWQQVCEATAIVRERLESVGMKPVAKTSGSKGMHVYVPIVRGPTQHEVWQVAKDIAWELARAHPKLLTAEYRIANRPPRHVLVDYNQNSFGRTLASVYSVRPRAEATVSAPITWRDFEAGIEIADFTMANMPARVAKRGDLWAANAPGAADRFDLAKVMG
jgi:bifunctional non-homologous end joining protein LigD